MRILVAEDQVVSRHILVANLRKWGYDVMAVENGTRAWEALQAEDAPPLAILDWLMPGMDGIEICRQIRQKPPGAANLSDPPDGKAGPGRQDSWPSVRSRRLHHQAF